MIHALLIIILTQVNTAETAEQDVWKLLVEQPVSTIEAPPDLLGDQWKFSPGMRIENLQDLKTLPVSQQKIAAALAAQLSPLGIRSCADYTFVKKGFPLDTITVRLFLFENAAQCRAWWAKKYQYAGWEKHYEPVKSGETVAVDSLQVNKRAIAFGNVWFTTQKLQKGREHLTVADFILDQLLEKQP